MNDVMLQLQDKDDFSPSWVKSAVCQHCYSLCRVWHHLPEVKGSGILSLIWNTRSLSHTRAQSRAHIILPRCTLAHVIACLHTWIQACTNTCIQALKDMRTHTHTVMSVWQMKEVNCLSLTSWVAAGGCYVEGGEMNMLAMSLCLWSHFPSFICSVLSSHCHISLFCNRFLCPPLDLALVSFFIPQVSQCISVSACFLTHPCCGPLWIWDFRDCHSVCVSSFPQAWRLG